MKNVSVLYRVTLFGVLGRVLLISLFLVAYSRADTDEEEYVWSAVIARPLYDPPIRTRIEYEQILEYRNALNVFFGKLIDENDDLTTVRIYVSPISQDSVDLLVVSKLRCNRFLDQ